MKLYDENIPVPGCTISNQEIENITHFSLAKHTSISKEKYPCDVLYIVDTGQVKMNEHTLQANDCLFVKANTLCGQEAITDTVYTEILIKEDTKMNEVLKNIDVIQLKDLIPYQKGKIVNMDLLSNDKMKFVIMAFDDGCALAEHAAPGNALIFALDGQATITYEGKDYAIQAGENFRFEKNGKHAVRANGPFKMALLLELEG